MTDHWLILRRFLSLATEDHVERSFQRFVKMDPGKDVHDSSVVHLLRLEDCIDNRFIRKYNVVGE